MFEVTKLEYPGIKGVALITPIPSQSDEQQMVDAELNKIQGYNFRWITGFSVGATLEGVFNVPHVIIMFDDEPAQDTGAGSLTLRLLDDDEPEDATEPARHVFTPGTIAVLYRN